MDLTGLTMHQRPVDGYGGGVSAHKGSPSGLSEIGKEIGAVQAAFKKLAAYLKSQGKTIANDVIAGTIVAGLTAAGHYGIKAVTNAVSSVASAGSAGGANAVNELNQASPGLGTDAQNIVNAIGSESASAYNSTITDISQIMDENGNINWGAIMNDLGPLGG